MEVVETTRDLNTLADEINDAHRAGEAAGILHYHLAGQKLIQAKAQCEPRKWLKWLEKNVEFSQQRANQYTQLGKLQVPTSNSEEEWREFQERWRIISGNAPNPNGKKRRQGMPVSGKKKAEGSTADESAFGSLEDFANGNCARKPGLRRRRIP